ncbi:hypothetical protein HDU84_004891, partial [Entophlyctis sp. JEL0112]
MVFVAEKISQKQSISFDEGSKQVFECIPADPSRTYETVLKAAVERKYVARQISVQRNDDSFLDEEIIQLLQIFEDFWLVDVPTITVLELEALKSAFEVGIIGFRGFLDWHKKILSRLSSTEKEIWTIAEIGLLLSDRISSFFDQPIGNYSKESSEEFELLVWTYDSFRSSLIAPEFRGEIDPETRDFLGTMIVESITIRFRKFFPEIPEPDGNCGQNVVDLAETVTIELKTFHSLFDNLILKQFHLPSIAADIYIDGLSHEINLFVNRVTETNNVPGCLDVGFNLYNTVKELVLVVEMIDFRFLQDGRIRIVEWFRVFVQAFVELSDTKINEWVENAVSVDDFQSLISGHSSSVLDIFTSFQQQLDFVMSLNWPSEIDVSIFIGNLIENIGFGLEKYVQLMKKLITSDLSSDQLKNLTNSTSSSPKPQKKRFRLRVRKEGPPVDPSEIRIDEKSCIQLSNIDCLVDPFDKLVETIPKEYQKHTAFQLSSKPQANHRFAGILTLLSAKDINVSRPFALLLSFRVQTISDKSANAAAPFGREIGRTSKKHQSKLITFTDTDYASIPLLLNYAEITNGLELCVIHHLPHSLNGKQFVSSDDGFAVASARFHLMAAMFESGQSTTFKVNIFGGFVTFRFSSQSDFVASTVRTRIVYVTNRTMEDASNVVVDKLCFDLRVRLKDASADHKKSVIIANNIANLFASKESKKQLLTPRSSSEIPNETAVDAKLSPFLNFIDANLAVLANHIHSLELADRVFIEIWARFIQIVESLIVPNLGDDNGILDRKKKWEESRVAFVGHALLLVKDFLHSDGKGLPHKQMETESFEQLRQILKYYSWQRKDLQRKHQLEMSGVTDWSDEWCLKLLKLKGCPLDYLNDTVESVEGGNVEEEVVVVEEVIVETVETPVAAMELEGASAPIAQDAEIVDTVEEIVSTKEVKVDSVISVLSSEDGVEVGPTAVINENVSNNGIAVETEVVTEKTVIEETVIEDAPLAHTDEADVFQEVQASEAVQIAVDSNIGSAFSEQLTKETTLGAVEEVITSEEVKVQTSVVAVDDQVIESITTTIVEEIVSAIPDDVAANIDYDSEVVVEEIVIAETVVVQANVTEKKPVEVTVTEEVVTVETVTELKDTEVIVPLDDSVAKETLVVEGSLIETGVSDLIVNADKEIDEVVVATTEAPIEATVTESSNATEVIGQKTVASEVTVQSSTVQIVETVTESVVEDIDIKDESLSSNAVPNEIVVVDSTIVAKVAEAAEEETKTITATEEDSTKQSGEAIEVTIKEIETDVVAEITEVEVKEETTLEAVTEETVVKVTESAEEIVEAVVPTNVFVTQETTVAAEQPVEAVASEDLAVQDVSITETQETIQETIQSVEVVEVTAEVTLTEVTEVVETTVTETGAAIEAAGNEPVATDVVSTEEVVTEVVPAEDKEVVATEAVAAETAAIDVVVTEEVFTEVVSTEEVATEVVAVEHKEVVTGEITTEAVAAEAVAAEAAAIDIVVTEEVATEV